MSIEGITSFEHLLQSQVTSLASCRAQDFDKTFLELAKQGLEWFHLDRLTLFPNSMILLQDGKTISVSQNHIPPLNLERFVVGNYRDYLKLLRSRNKHQMFSSQDLKNSKLSTLTGLYAEGARWHGIVRLELFGQVWGALAFSRFNDDHGNLSDEEVKQLKVLSDIWLVYWQHSTVTKSLNSGGGTPADESEKLLRLSSKQCKVLTLLAQGFTAKQCAEKLFLSPRTIESHKYRMLDTLELDSHTELVQFALRNGLGIEDY